jgi:hypothetical protein
MFQAKIFAEGAYTAPSPPLTEFFTAKGSMLALTNGSWFGTYLPGFAAILAASMLIHAEWILCPTLGALSIAIWILYARRWHDNLHAFLLSLLCLFSPFLLLMSSTIMVHTPELFVSSAGVYLIRLETESSSWRHKVLLGMLLVSGLLVRGFSIMVFTAPLLAYAIWLDAKKRKVGLLIVTVVSVLLGTAAVAFFQWKTTGDPLLPGYSFSYKDPLIYGFGKNVLQQVHSPLRGLENISNDILGLNHWLNGWLCGSLIFIFYFLLYCKWSKWDRLLLISCLSVLAFYFFYLFQDLVIGPRFIYPLAPVALLFVARSILNADSKIITPTSFLLFLFLFSFASYIPFRMSGFILKYEPSNTQAGALKKAIQSTQTQRKLVFLEKNISQHFVNWNDPWLRDSVVLVRDMGTKNEEAIRIFPERVPVYFGLRISLDAKSEDNGYNFRAKRTDRPSGFISLMEVGLAMNASSRYPDRDFFDFALPIFLDGTSSDEQFNFLSHEMANAQARQTTSSFFKMGLIHTSRMMLLFKKAHEKNGSNWIRKFPYEEFRRMNNEAIQCLEQAREPGKQIIPALHKVNRRIDRDGDARFSDAELKRYLQMKINILQLSDW